MSKPEDEKPVAEPAETLTDEQLEQVAGGLLPAVHPQLNIANALQNNARAVVSSIGGAGLPNLDQKIQKT